MKRVLTAAFIIFYVGALTYGNICHLVQEGRSFHPLMYFVVWDMFCGWSAFDSRIHIVAEGESGKFYDLTHPPYGELHPYGYIGRESYDQFQSHTPTMGLNVLKHTRHEPMTRLLVIEECWAKKYNMVDAVWKARYDDPKDINRYYRRRVTLLPDGTVVQNYSSWLLYQYSLMVMQNPRLVEESRKGTALFVLDEARQPGGRDVLETRDTTFGGTPAPVSRSIAPSGN
jgi:hypothetical protein